VFEKRRSYLPMKALAARRLTLALGLVAALVLSTVGASVPVQASGQLQELTAPTVQLQGGDPAARLQVIIKSVQVANDRDGFLSGEGDIRLTATFWRCTDAQHPCSAGSSNPAKLLAQAERSFDADSGDMVNLNRVFPLTPDVKDVSLASEATGFAVHAGRNYLLEINAFERDPGGGDFMGGIQRDVNESNGWGIGLHTLEPAGFFADTSLPNTGILCAGCGGIIVGDYLVTYEIRRTPLPDLVPTAIRVVKEAGGNDDQVCLGLKNAGQAASGPARLNLYVDNTAPPNGGVQAAGLAAGASNETCIQTIFPASGLHQLRLVADQFRTVPEMNELNNDLVRGFQFGAFTPPPGGGVLDPGISTNPGGGQTHPPIGPGTVTR
jgi:hypothetical protein